MQWRVAMPRGGIGLSTDALWSADHSSPGRPQQRSEEANGIKKNRVIAKGHIVTMWFDTDACGNELWYLVHCQLRKETYAANSLEHLLNLRVFLPESQVHSQRAIKHVPFFPGYIFAYVDLHKIPKSRINTCPGVLRLVEFGGSPQSVPQYVIDTITQQLNRLNRVHSQTYHNFSPGDTVQVKHGPLQNLEMVFLGSTTPSSRVYVLLELLGRLKEVQVDVDMLEKAPTKLTVSQELSAQRERHMREKSQQIQR